MAAYPDIISEIPGMIPFDWTANQVILSTEFASGRESRRLVWQSPRRTVKLYYSGLDVSKASALWNFYRDRSGPLQAFSFYFPRQRVYSNEFVGVSDGSNKTIRLPSKDANSYTFKQGSSTVSPSQYTFHQSTGTGVSDYLVLNTAAAGGVKYYWSFTGRLKIKARFSEQGVPFSDIKDISGGATIDIVGLQHEITTT